MSNDEDDVCIPSYLLADLEELGISSRPIFQPTPAQLTIAAADVDFRKIKRIQRHEKERRQQKVDETLPKPPSRVDVNAIQKKLFINAVDSSLPIMHASTNMHLREKAATQMRERTQRILLEGTNSKSMKKNTNDAHLFIDYSMPLSPPSPSVRLGRSSFLQTPRKLVLRGRQTVSIQSTATPSENLEQDKDSSSPADKDKIIEEELASVTVSAEVASQCTKSLITASFALTWLRGLHLKYMVAWTKLRTVIERWRTFSHRMFRRNVVRCLSIQVRAKVPEHLMILVNVFENNSNAFTGLTKLQQLIRTFLCTTRSRLLTMLIKLENMSVPQLRPFFLRRTRNNETYNTLVRNTFKELAIPSLLRIIREVRSANSKKTQVKDEMLFRKVNVTEVREFIRSKTTTIYDINISRSAGGYCLSLFANKNVVTDLELVRKETLGKLKANPSLLLAAAAATEESERIAADAAAAAAAAGNRCGKTKNMEKRSVAAEKLTPKQMQHGTIALVAIVNSYLRRAAKNK